MRNTPWGAVRRTPGSTRLMRSEAALPAPSRRFLAISAAMALILSLMAVFAVPAFGGEKGNDEQGTVKIHEGPDEPDPEEKNEPKVCTFHIHGFNFHAAEEIVWEIKAKGDNGWQDGAVVLAGEATADSEGEWRDPEATAYELPPGHYKLFVDRVDRLGGPIKHKVFKVECEDEVSPTSIVTTTTSTTVPPTTTTTVPPTTTTTVPPTTTTTVPPTTTTTVPPTTTTTVPPTTTTTVPPTTTTTVPPTTTTTVPPTTTTTVPPTTSTTVGEDVGGVVVTTSTTTVEDTTTTTTPIEDEVLGTVVTTSTTAPVVPVSTAAPDEVLGTSVEDEVLGTSVEAEDLPFTGIDSERLIGLAVLLMAAGLVVLGSTGRREES